MYELSKSTSFLNFKTLIMAHCVRILIRDLEISRHVSIDFRPADNSHFRIAPMKRDTLRLVCNFKETTARCFSGSSPKFRRSCTALIHC